MRVRLVLIPLIAAAALLAGCSTKSPPATPAPTDNGISALSAEEILAKAQAALDAAPSYKLSGQMTSDGETGTIDLQVSGANKKATLTLTGSTIEIVIIGSDLYVKVPEAMLTALVPPEQQSFLGLIKGKFIKVSASDTRFADLPNSLKSSEILKPEGTLAKGETSTIDGTPVITLTSTKDGKVSTMAIATVGQPLPIQMTAPDNGGTAKFTYSGTVTISAPPADQVFDLKALLGG